MKPTEEQTEAGVKACAVWRLGHCDEELAVLVDDIFTAMQAKEPKTTQLQEAMDTAKGRIA